MKPWRRKKMTGQGKSLSVNEQAELALLENSRLQHQMLSQARFDGVRKNAKAGWCYS